VPIIGRRGKKRWRWMAVRGAPGGKSGAPWLGEGEENRLFPKEKGGRPGHNFLGFCWGGSATFQEKKRAGVLALLLCGGKRVGGHSVGERPLTSVVRPLRDCLILIRKGADSVKKKSFSRRGGGSAYSRSWRSREINWSPSLAGKKRPRPLLTGEGAWSSGKKETTKMPRLWKKKKKQAVS